MNAITRNDTWQRIGDLADRVRRLRPDHRDPERFHIEKSEIEHQLRRLAAALGPSPDSRAAGQETPRGQPVQELLRG